MDKNILSIIIPTYNRSKMLDECLSHLYVLYQETQFKLIICNNNSTDETLNVIKKWEDCFSDLTVVNHDNNLLYDRNFASGYRQVNTEYCWLLGDSNYVDKENYRKILDVLISRRPHSLVLNDADRTLLGDDIIYTDCNQLLYDLGWYTTLLSSCIIRKEFLSEERYQRYYDTCFLHEGVFLDYLSSIEEFSVHVMPSIHMSEIRIENKYNSGWRQTPFLVFGKCWFSFIMSLPFKYTVENKLHCIKEHNRQRKIFSPRQIFKNKISGRFGYKDYTESRKYLKFVIDTPLIVYDIINIFPPMPKLLFVMLKLKRLFVG